MEVDTRFGKVVTRENATSLQRSHSVLLKDNPSLRPLFEWLKNLQINSSEDFKWEKIKKELEDIKINCETKFRVGWDIPMLIFHNMAPLQGDFQNSIEQTINLFYKAMYSPEEVML